MGKTTERAFSLSLAILFLVTTVGFSAYAIWEMFNKKDDSQASQQLAEQQKQQEDPLKGQQLENFEPTNKVEKLKIEDLVKGDGKEVKADSTVTAHYTGALVSTGKIFESSLSGGEPATFALSQVIEGWREGVPGMKVGGKRRLIIPADMAYGKNSPSPDIPANSALVFDIELIDVK
jgi:FKBP-type peptidyl-prolyl cis-trans isomerase